MLYTNISFAGVLNDGTEVQTMQSRKRLQRLIRTHDTSFLSMETPDTEGEIHLSETNNEENSNNTCDASDIDWYLRMLNEIQNSTKCIDNSSHSSSNVSINNYQCTELNAYLQHLLSKLPLWSCVMCSYFKAPNALGNSCNVESQYSLLKNHIFHKCKLPVNPVVFVRTYIKRIDSVATLMKWSMKQSAIMEGHESINEIGVVQNTDTQTHEISEVRSFAHLFSILAC